MIFQGDLSKYHPADALMFLSQLSLNGALSVANGQQMITLSFNAGRLLDAHSEAGDEKMLRVLRFRQMIARDQEIHIRKARSETGMSVRQVLNELAFFPLAQIKNALEIGISEVLLELFLLDEGQFHFTDTSVEPDSAGIKLDTGAALIKVLSHSDELRNFEKNITTLDRGIGLEASTDQTAALSHEERVLAHLASRVPNVRQLLIRTPIYSHRAMQITEKLLEAGILRLAPIAESDGTPDVASAPSIDPLFGAYKQAFKTLIRTDEVLKRVEAVIGFCKNFYDAILILTAKGQKIIHCKMISVDKERSIHQKTIKGVIGAIEEDPVFQAVHKTGIGFFGKTFPSPLIDRVAQAPPDGECALLPIVNKAQLSIFFYTFSSTQHEGLSPHHYLELLSWMISTTDKVTGTEKAAVAAPAAERETPPPPDAGEIAAKLVAKIEELPPLPSMASRSLQLLSDPETPMETVEKTIAHDQALVAKIIKVSNSALYGGYQKANSLRQALTRLGAKTTKSLVLAASTHGYFFKKRKGMKVWGPILWQHSVECGFAARQIAAICHYEDPEQAFMGGIMHDIGKLAMLMVDDAKYMEIQRIKITENITDLAAETEMLGSNHTELGLLLMEKWRMPEAVQACSRFHHTPHEAGEHTTLAAIVAYADHLSHTLGSHPQPETDETLALADSLMRTIDLSPEHNTLLMKKVRTDFDNTELIG